MNDLHLFTLASDGSMRDAFRAYLVATLTYQRFRGIRVALVYVLVAIGLLNWFSTGWPDLLPSGFCSMVWDSWLAVFVGALIAAGFEWSWHKAQMRCLNRLGQPFKDPEPNAGPQEAP